MNFLKKIVNRFIYAVSGIIYAVNYDFSFRLHFYFGVLILSLFIFFLHPLNQFELLWILLSYFLILITELQNSAFELALDKLHPGHHSDIGRSKDMAAGAVLLAGLFLLISLSVIFYGKFFS